mgnify:CR=1 FL=1
MDKIAVLIPCYNESRTIEKVVTDFKRVLPEATIYSTTIIPPTGTDELARGAGATVRYEYRRERQRAAPDVPRHRCRVLYHHGRG